MMGTLPNVAKYAVFHDKVLATFWQVLQILTCQNNKFFATSFGRVRN